MIDLLDTKLHLLRRNVGKTKFCNEIGYKEADTFHKFPDEIESELNYLIEDNFELSFSIVKIGRKELEEKILEKYAPFYNVGNTSKSSDKAYSIEKIREKHKNAYAPWTLQDDNKLWDLREAGKSIEELGLIFGRNRGAITSRLEKLELRRGI
jgi:hypothetical protein